MAREEEKLDQQANDQPSQPQPPWEASKPGTHRKGQKQELTQAFYLFQNLAAVWSEGVMLSQSPYRTSFLEGAGFLGEVRLYRPLLQASSVQKAQLPATGAWDQQVP